MPPSSSWAASRSTAGGRPRSASSTRAVAADGLDAAVTEVVDRLLLGGPEALAAAKRLIATVPTMGRDEAFAWATSLSEALFASAEAAGGIAAFKERRPAPWVPDHGS